MVYKNAFYSVVEKAIASFDSYADAEVAASILRKGGADVSISPTPDGVDENNCIKYAYIVIVKITVITTKETLVW